MKMKLLVLIIISTGLLALGVIRSASKITQQPKDVPPKNQLQWHVKQAKDEGRQKVQISAPVVDYLGSVVDTDQALSLYSLVVATPIEKRTYQITDNIVTWYKFSIVESLTELKNPVCFGCQSAVPPSDMLPLNPNEFLLAKSGGKVVLEGVEIDEVDAGYPEFQVNERYLLLISLYPSGVAITAGGPTGVFKIGETGTLMPINDRPALLKEGVKSRFGNSLASVKAHLKLQHSR